MKERWWGVLAVLGMLAASAAVERSPPWMQGPHAARLSPYTHFSRRGGPLPGYLPLKPVSSHRHSRWFDEPTENAQHSQSRAGYDRYPPFWSDHQKPPKSKSFKPNYHRQPKKECNQCNSVPWTPIFKSPAGLSFNRQPHELVPHVEVYPEASIQQNSILSPQSLAVSTVLEPAQSLNLPIGNVPVSPSLLLPPIKQIPFPELSPYNVAPVHDSARFNEPIGLVPPVAPKESANVIVTISEPETYKNVQLVGANDQHSESSSLVDSHVPQNYAHAQNFLSHQNQLQNHHYYQPQSSGLDIVKSVPLAEYTSSIEHPAHVIQSSFIDVQTQTGPPNTVEYTYEKTPQTGSQKVSDFILTGVKNTKKVNDWDSDSASSDKVVDHATSPERSPQNLPVESQPTYIKHEDGNGQFLDPNILTPPAPPLPPHLSQLLPTFDTAFLHPLFPVENKGVASHVNSAFLPPPQPQAMNPTTLEPTETTVPPKKIQIIIPYTTVKDRQDQNTAGSSLHNYNQSVVLRHTPNIWPPIVVSDANHNQPRRVPTPANFNKTWSFHTPSENSQIQHILASDIRDLLKKELEPKQNIRLQKNIDNWTALEYSNHKIVGKKLPGDLITHANAVTSIPGTSISHLLFPSKKIPAGYFPTSVAPFFDEPATTPFPATSVSVNSEPFTTVSRYSSVAYSGPSSSARPARQPSHTTQLPESEKPEVVTPAPSWSHAKVSLAPGTNEKVYVVTPVSSFSATRRSTRHIETTEKYNPDTSSNALFTKLEKVTNLDTPEQLSEKSKNKQKTFYPKSTGLFRIKADPARYQKISKFAKPKPIDKFFATTTTSLSDKTVESVSNPDTTSEAPTTAAAVSTTPIISSSATPAMFPFRNGGEIPLEMSQVDFSPSQLTFKNAGSRKTLIKQVKTNNRRPSDSSEKEKDELESDPSKMEVDVVLPVKSYNKNKSEGKKSTSLLKKKPAETAEKGNKTQAVVPLKPDEPNITEDDREEINDLMKELALRAEKDNETLLAVETTAPLPVDPVPINSSSTSLLDTIKLLREFLEETSDEEVSQEKSAQIGKVIEKLNTTEPASAIEDSKYKNSFPEYLTGELQLNKDEMSLVKNAMVELKKSRVRKKEEHLQS